MYQYIQTDAFCIVVLLIIFISLVKRKETTMDQKVFHMFIISTIWSAMSDMMSYIFDGKTGTVAALMLWSSNMAYFISSILACFLWLMYVAVKVEFDHPKIRKKRYFGLIPFTIFTIFVLLSPLHKMIFTIVETKDSLGNLVYTYARGNYLFIHWIFAASFILFPSLYALVKVFQEKEKYKRKQLLPLFFVLFFPVLCAVVQVLAGGSLLQVGMTLAVLYIFICQHSQNAYTDELTALNNRRCLNIYVQEKMTSLPADTNIFMIMMDIDHFKVINDTFGHKMGDDVLRTMGWILRESVARRKNIMAARYGGDEFVIFGYGLAKAGVVDLISEINAEVQMENITDHTVNIQISVGYVDGRRDEFSNTEMLFSEADTEMYKVKERKKKLY